MNRQAEAGIDESTRAEARALRERWHRELKPVGLLQELLVDEIARAARRLEIAAEWEETTGPDNRDWVRYQGQAERTFYRGLAELRRLAKAEAKGERAAETIDVPAVAAGPVTSCSPSPEIPGEGTIPAVEVGADPAPFARFNLGAPGGEGTVHWRPVAESIQGDPAPQPPRISNILSGAGAYSNGSML